MSSGHFGFEKVLRTHPNVSKVLVCKCGRKYIKTREKQTVCLRCLHGRL